MELLAQHGVRRLDLVGVRDRFCIDSQPGSLPGSAKDHSKIVTVRSTPTGRMTLGLMSGSAR